MSVQIKVRFTILALERHFIYYLAETLEFNIQAFLLSCKLICYEPTITYTFVAQTQTGFVDLASI